MMSNEHPHRSKQNNSIPKRKTTSCDVAKQRTGCSWKHITIFVGGSTSQDFSVVFYQLEQRKLGGESVVKWTINVNLTWFMSTSCVVHRG